MPTVPVIGLPLLSAVRPEKFTSCGTTLEVVEFDFCEVTLIQSTDTVTRIASSFFERLIDSTFLEIVLTARKTWGGTPGDAGCHDQTVPGVFHFDRACLRAVGSRNPDAWPRFDSRTLHSKSHRPVRALQTKMDSSAAHTILAVTVGSEKNVIVQ